MNNSCTLRIMVLGASLLTQLCAICFHARGAAGDVDLSFDPGSGINRAVKTAVLQADGKLIIGGEFTTVRGLARQSIARLHADGSGDPTFDAGTNADGHISTIKMQSDGKAIFTRDFYNLTGAPPGHKVARLNADGTLDSSFVPVVGPFPYGSGFTCVAVQSDDKILLGGYFNYQSVDEAGFVSYLRRSVLIRLNPNGSSDSTFTNGNGSLGGPLSAMAVQPDGKILIAGDIATAIEGTNHYGIVRLNTDGTADSSFVPAVDGFVHFVAVQPDLKIVVGGSYIGNGTMRNAIARLHADGSLDADFDSSAGGIHALNSFVLVPETGTMLITGAFREADDQVRTRIVRLHANGTLDNSFDSGTGVGSPNNSGVALALQPDGRAFVAGAFTTFDGISRERVTRLNTDGSFDASFEPGASINGPVNTVLLQPDGKLLVRGQFTTVHGGSRNRVARLQPSGAVDSSFDPGAGVSGASYALEISTIAAQADGKVMIGGDFSSVSGTSRYRLARLHSSGSVDSSFVSGIGGMGFDSSPVQAIAMLPDGRMLIAEPGGVDGLNPPKKIARLDSSGNVDDTFNPVIPGAPGSYDSEAASLLVQPDGKIIVAGVSFYDAYHTGLLLRLNIEGSIDAGFERTDVAGSLSQTLISAVALQPDGKVLIGGNFASIKGASRNGIARMNAGGTLDSSFNPGSGVSGAYDPTVLSIHVQPDGRILIGGSFTSFNSTARNNFARLNADGTLDSTFNTGGGADDVVRSIALQPDDRVLIGGSFNTINGIPRPYVARLYGDAPLHSLHIVRSDKVVTISWPLETLSGRLQENANPAALDAWSTVTQPAVTNNARFSVTLPATAQRSFFRLKPQ